MDKMKSEKKIKLVINGIEIPKLSDYSFFDAKSFFTSPKRTALGVIKKLNSYATFLTPRLTFSFKLMPIEAYRVLMKLIKDYNEFIVTVYDIVEDDYATHKMYFNPKEFPQIYQRSLEVLGILNERFELVGTNDNIDGLSLIYNNNSTPVINTGLTTYYGYDVMIGDYDNIDESVDPSSFTKEGFKFNSWNTKEDGSGTPYVNGSTIKMSKSLVLYAQWIADNNFILSYDYQNADSGSAQLSKKVIYNQEIGELPSPVKNGYTFGGWFTRPNGAGIKVLPTTKYDYSFNMTIYAYWVGVDNTIKFNSNGGIGEMSDITAKTGVSVTLPKSQFTKSGKVFKGWSDSKYSEKIEYTDNETFYMPNKNLTLFAIYQDGFYITYDTNGGTNDGFKELGISIKSAIYTEKNGFALSGWYSDNNFENAVSFPLNLESNTTIYARWEEV